MYNKYKNDIDLSLVTPISSSSGSNSSSSVGSSGSSSSSSKTSSSSSNSNQNCTAISANSNFSASAGACLSYECTGIFEMKNSSQNNDRTASSIAGGCSKGSVTIPRGNAWTAICENSTGELQIVVGTGSWNNTIQVRCTEPSSSSGEANSSSSSEGSTPILGDQMLIANSQKTYYNLKGEPLGAQKPTKPGVYIVKNTKTRQIKKEVVK
jgi:hypothetical protein